MYRLLVAIAVLSTYLAAAHSARAADARVPASLYPSGTHITYQPQVSNAEMDCDWGFSFDRHPGDNRLLQPRTLSLFHLRTQDQLHRIGGWSQLGVSTRGHQVTQFSLYASEYAAASTSAGILWSRQALLDFQLAAWLHGYRSLAHASGLLPAGMSGKVLVTHRQYGSLAVLLLAYQSGPQEVEGMVSTTGGRAARQAVWQDLVQRAHAASSKR